MSGIQSSALEYNPHADGVTRVSVIIPAYNASLYIKETLDSVFAQTYSNYEVIIVNDGSPDTEALEPILAPYMSRVIYITQENRGPNGARNTGLQTATGEFVALLDSDDIWLPNYLEEQVRFLHQHPDNDLVYCNARIFGDSIYNGKEFMDVCPSKGEATSLAIISRECHVFVSILARRRSLLSVGFDESFRRSEDFECWIRFTATGYRIGYHRQVLVLYRRHAESNSADQIAMAEENLRVLNRALTLWPVDSAEARCLSQKVTERTAELERLHGKFALRGRQFDEARKRFQAANCHFRSVKLAIVIALLKLMPSFVRITYDLRAALFRAHRDSQV